MSSKSHPPEQSNEQEQERLLSEFSYPTYEDWYNAAVELLKGASFEKKLLTPTYEGITLRPLYREHDLEGVSHTASFPGFAPYVRGNRVDGHKTQPWDVAQEIPYGRPQEFNRALRNDLTAGQTAVNLILDSASQQGHDPDHAPPEEIGGGGVSLTTSEDLERALDGVDLEQTPLLIDAGESAIAVTALLAAHLHKQGKSLQKLRGGIGLDPLHTWITTGTLPYPLEIAYKKMAGLTHWAKTHAPRLTTITVQGLAYHNSGASAVQELACVLTTAVEYLREMQAVGLTVDDVAPRMRLVMAVGTSYFMEIAKLRATRLVWAKAVKAFGGNEASQKSPIHVRTSSWNKTVHDPYVNMLRTTVEAFAGTTGGCESMHVSCFDEPIGPPDDFSRRIARNTQLILHEEAHVTDAIDPAGGSWYVEALTDAIARNAWQLFQDIERQGGMAQALQHGFPQEQIARTAAQRKEHLSTRHDVLIGTTMHPNVEEQLIPPRYPEDADLATDRAREIANYRIAQGAAIESLVTEKLSKILNTSPAVLLEAAIEAVTAGATLGDIEHALRVGQEASPTIPPLNIHRGAEIFEALRAATDAYTAKTGARPAIFLANMGPIPQHKARADFSISFFEVGGFEMLNNNGFLSVDEAAQAAIASGAPAVVICSTDDTYPDLVPPLTQSLKAAKPEIIVILAGYPQEHLESFRAAGVDEFIHRRTNLYDVLVKLMKRLGILA
ncbi:methylmalonyl-CoA mutase [candidate division KSB3 bacterium]|uniref:Methylmalonyl-CoA mutase n=1 Tax=candidate division KSB3 bacterium TaxID=2044937 RepID=A0A9D5Q7H9_9BACT|nr:methylmalonyl-CoA mutase [candidate division KSB3 bacterium]MBD3326909.1 methylmalonyl-CoA mutase [candidate division KSB3 bacterium]